MPFQLLPVIDRMIELYEEPPGFDRFHKYIAIINGNSKSDMEMPVGGYNPMAKSHVLHRLKELKAMQAEDIIAEVCAEVNMVTNIRDIFKVSLTLADDLMGGWTEHCSTDYSSRFKLNAMVKRHFCCVYLYTSEEISEDTIQRQTKACLYRTLYWMEHPKPQTLEQHIGQESAFAKAVPNEEPLSTEAFDTCKRIYERYKGSSDYPVILSFLYGDKAAKALGYIPLGIPEDNAGYRFAQMLAEAAA